MSFKNFLLGMILSSYLMGFMELQDRTLKHYSNINLKEISDLIAVIINKISIIIILTLILNVLNNLSKI